MEKLTIRDELRSIDFHGAILKYADQTGHALTLVFERAAIIGHSRPDDPKRIPSPLNPGEDRYAAPELEVTFSGVCVISIGKGGSWSRNPAKRRTPGQLIPRVLHRAFWKKVRTYNMVYELFFDAARGVWVMCFWLTNEAACYEVLFTAETSTARFEVLGDITWDVKDLHRRQRSQANRGDAMIYGAIDEKSQDGYTCLAPLFSAIGNAQLEYNWLITDFECYPMTPQWNELREQEYIWLTGRELTELVAQEDFQWIWAVFSGFPKEVTLEQILAHPPLPISDGYSGFWCNPISLQHPLSRVEIVPFDSSLTLLISRDEKLVTDFRRAFPKSESLSEYNART